MKKYIIIIELKSSNNFKLDKELYPDETEYYINELWAI
jgi:hypothetical protein